MADVVRVPAESPDAVVETTKAAVVDATMLAPARSRRKSWTTRWQTILVVARLLLPLAAPSQQTGLLRLHQPLLLVMMLT